jgi:hypothetical protein
VRLGRVASVVLPVQETRPTAEEVTLVAATEVLSAPQVEATRRWIAEMALRCVRAERASRGGDDWT